MRWGEGGVACKGACIWILWNRFGAEIVETMSDFRTVPDQSPEIKIPPPQRAVEISGLDLVFEAADGEVHALSGIDLTVDGGDFVSFIGPSGCGKTTLMRVIADLQEPSSGTVRVNGFSPREARLKRTYGYVFQAPGLYPWRSVEDNVTLPLEIMGLTRAERAERAARVLALVNLTGFERKFPWQLSGGMQQRVSIARALSFDPEILLMDEPFGALDEILRDHLNEQLLKLWKRTRKTVIFVTHSIPEAVFLSTKIVVMSPRPGRVIDIIESRLPHDRTLDMRDTPEFIKIAKRVRDGLRAAHSYDD
jgi:NitT/TauT family transport system ATP-binding protein